MPPAARRVALASIILAALFAVPALARTDLARVPLRADRADLAVLLAAGFDVAAVHRTPPEEETGPPTADVLLKRGDGDMVRLRALGFDARIVRRDLERWYASRLQPQLYAVSMGPPGFGQGAMGGYYTLAGVEAVLDHYAATYPHLVAPKQSIGTSHQGRPIWAVKVSDNPALDEGEPKVLFDALHHAREPMSMQTLLWVMDHLVTRHGSDPEVAQLVDTREIWFVPCVNPDGYVFNQMGNPGGGGLWRKNRRNNPGDDCDGVDLNRNYTVGFGGANGGSSNDTCDEDYRGPSALSEPETAALNAFVAAKDFATAWSMHTYGDQLLKPYGWTPALPANAATYDAMGGVMAGLNGYEDIHAWDLYPVNGGAIDTYNDVHGALAFTPEIGPDFWPPVGDMVEIAQENLEPALWMIRWAGSWVVVADVAFAEVAGDGDGFADPGETLDLVVTLANDGIFGTGGSVGLALASPSADVTVVIGASAAPALAPGAAAAAAPLRIALAPGAGPQTIALALTVTVGGTTFDRALPLDVGTPRVILKDEAETNLGWIAGAPGDTADAGRWTRANPVGTTVSGEAAQPENDATPAPGVSCFVTGNAHGAAGDDDVDGGFTTLLTPVFDLSAAVAPRVRYARHVFNDDGDDPFTASISNDGGATWVDLEEFLGSQNQWTAVEWRVEDFVAKTAAMRLRFVAVDDPNNSITEALVDDLEVIDYGAAPHLGLFGRPAIGGTVELQLAGPPGTNALVLVSSGTGSATLWPVAGTLGLDPASLLLAFSVTIPADGLYRLAVPLPSSPGAVGQSAYLQAIVTGPPVFSNVAKLTAQGS